MYSVDTKRVEPINALVTTHTHTRSTTRAHACWVEEGGGRTWCADAGKGVGAVGGDVEVAQLDRLEELALVAVHQDVGRLDVAVEDLVAVEVVQPARHL
jgi:hypothetical protein